MGHSTGAEDQLDRLKPTSFGSKEYSTEELKAEMTAALVSQRYGMTKHLKEDSAAYLKGWLESLKEEPTFIKTILTDVKKASQMITQKVDAIQLQLNKGVQETKDESNGVKTPERNEQEEAKTEAKQSESLAAKALPKQEENTGYRFHR